MNVKQYKIKDITGEIVGSLDAGSPKIRHEGGNIVGVNSDLMTHKFFGDYIREEGNLLIIGQYRLQKLAFDAGVYICLVLPMNSEISGTETK